MYTVYFISHAPSCCFRYTVGAPNVKGAPIDQAPIVISRYMLQYALIGGLYKG